MKQTKTVTKARRKANPFNHGSDPALAANELALQLGIAHSQVDTLERLVKEHAHDLALARKTAVNALDAALKTRVAYRDLMRLNRQLLALPASAAEYSAIPLMTRHVMIMGMIYNALTKVEEIEAKSALMAAGEQDTLKTAEAPKEMHFERSREGWRFIPFGSDVPGNHTVMEVTGSGVYVK